VTDNADKVTDSPEKETTAVPVEADETAAREVTETSGVEAGADEAEVVEDTADADETTEEEATEAKSEPKVKAKKPRRAVNWSKVLAFGLLPAVALLLAGAAGYLKWSDSSVREANTARIESLQVAKDSTVRLLSYKPDTVDQDLNSARDLLTGDFRDSYTQLINDVVIPGAKEKQISAVANVPAVASVSAEPNHAVALVFVNQTVIVGQSAPTATASSVRVTLDKVGDHWLISQFDPV
jgi:Mce-associated membrane protein